MSNDTPVSVQAHPPTPLVIPVSSADGARFELLCCLPSGGWTRLLYWVPAMGMPARHYLPLAQALAARGVATVLHEWRGVGSSDRRANRRCSWSYRELLEYDLAAGMQAVGERWPQASCMVGGHSLGGQLGVLFASLHPHSFEGLVLVASGSPYWRRFRHGSLISLAYRTAPLLARGIGYLPGRRLGFAGNEAHGVIADWARSGLSGRYAAQGMAVDFEGRLGALVIPALALRLHDDWMVPPASLDWLLRKLGAAPQTVRVITQTDLDGTLADHFAWMKAPGSIAEHIVEWSAGKNAAFASPVDTRA
jgi:predicted alpha/beta hydrolase